MTEAMIEAEAILDRGLMTEIDEDTLLSEACPEYITIQKGHIEEQIISEIEVTAGYQGSDINLDPLPEDVASRCPSSDKDRGVQM